MKPAGGLAVMAGRREPPTGLEFFPTPPWSTRALLVHVLPWLGIETLRGLTVWDPAAGEGHMAEVLREACDDVHASDVWDYGRGYPVADFLDPATRLSRPPHGIITNPPFRCSLEFAQQAIEMAPIVCLLLRTGWVEGEARYRHLFSARPPRLIAQFSERVPMTKGAWDPSASTATAYAWFCWVGDAGETRFVWIPPGQRKALTRPDDAARFGKAAAAPLFEVA